MTDSLTCLTTEKRNERTNHMDQMSTSEILSVMNEEDHKVAEAVKQVLPAITTAVDHIASALKKGGRLFYVGAGTSGRLGILDASECPPTFMADPEMVQAVMAGGGQAFTKAKENSEDDVLQGGRDIQANKLTNQDVVVGITASGRTPYPIGALEHASKVGAYTISLSCNRSSEISDYAECPIEVVVGPEVLTGSTRLKSATAHKMVLNMMSTTAMIKLGKVYENLMVDVHASNHKLRERAKSILMECSTASYEEAEQTLKDAKLEVKPAIVMLKRSVSYEKAKQLLQGAGGNLRKAVEESS
ncbi:N-acetylmuramic acid 6-phosphate etherase [Halobacillus karajensis]|uniref:N-acetylmuramic acid 6-phosphate etherase n=1 Tax=Halobacillus karajensis TaxID=195088 RepID=A0A024P3E9_9BACI|nr:N-acetylmuramic acid 6-phosphate etherase [Halobacillus karajensis]CDQ19149.1 N-acetylmuramic acid 6-phosphate etherase [Halobacillus karajensis]CDQ22777.1 N-acetylmuramic acid 6-phosphate etherase [Halobacillus karajensis]CDQ26259.1 N-acetylmuramic acid 6-phosphate etherase [Halobacillus karajensis]